MTKERIVLGTVQFGLAYGITNSTGKVSFEEVKKILDLALKNGVNTLDCASTYGDSEAAVGKAAYELGKSHSFKAISKVHLKDGDIKSQVYSQIEKTLKDLKGIGLFGLLAHHGQQILQYRDEFTKVLYDAQREFKISRIGASVYDLSELENIQKVLKLELIQIPFNVFNQSFLEGEILARLTHEGCEVHARSLFLQGLLLAKKSPEPQFFAPYKNNFDHYHEVVKDSGMSALDLNLAHGFKQSSIHKLVLGVTSSQEFVEVLQAVERAQHAQLPNLGHLASHDEALINPAKWKV